ncbi:helix-turn-helix domain-containing protein, partial [Streptomyces sp. BG9H]
MSELFDAVDALVESRAALPPPAERKRLRAAHGLTIDEVATALKVRRATVSGWESGKTEPRPPERNAYARLLNKLAGLYPADPADAAAPVQDAAVQTTFTAAPSPAEAPPLPKHPAPEAAAPTTTENTQPPARTSAPA